MAWANPAGAGVDPGRAVSGDQERGAIQFHQVHEPSGKRIKYEKVVPGIGPVDRDEIVKGYEVSKGHYVLLDPEEIESVKLESRKTLDLVEFVDEDDIDAMYFEKPYYVVPADDLAEEAYVVLRDALKAAKKVGVGQLAMRGQEYVVALKPCGRGLLLETLRYADEVHKRPASSATSAIQARRRPARHGLDADRAESRRVRSQRIPQPLRRCASSR